jgi:uncharacterized phiE125 gp8 family phage protein
MRNSIIDINKTEDSAEEPVTLEEVKAHIVVDHTLDDTLLTALITQCRKSIENYCSISMVQKTIALISDWNHDGNLPAGPVVEISEVKFRADVRSDYSTLVADQDFFLEGNYFTSNLQGRHKITYTAGPESIEDDLKLALLNEIAYRYESRGDQVNRYAAQNVGLSEGADELLKPYIDYSWM